MSTIIILLCIICFLLWDISQKIIDKNVEHEIDSTLNTKEDPEISQLWFWLLLCIIGIALTPSLILIPIIWVICYGLYRVIKKISKYCNECQGWIKRTEKNRTVANILIFMIIISIIVLINMYTI